jgi:heme-degrading monooxygenase HmoA
MKRPIAELLMITLKPGAEAARRQSEHEAWQILRRKQGYVTHRVYEQLTDPLQHLVYSEWESKKAVDGARQHLRDTPLMRRARSTLASVPQRIIFDLIGPVTSTKGLELPKEGVAAMMMSRRAADDHTWQPRETQLWKVLSSQPGHITHLLLRGFDDPLLVGSLSHWLDGSAFEAALMQARNVAGETLPADTASALYRALPW